MKTPYFYSCTSHAYVFVHEVNSLLSGRRKEGGWGPEHLKRNLTFGFDYCLVLVDFNRYSFACFIVRNVFEVDSY